MSGRKGGSLLQEEIDAEITKQIPASEEIKLETKEDKPIRKAKSSRKSAHFLPGTQEDCQRTS